MHKPSHKYPNKIGASKRTTNKPRLGSPKRAGKIGPGTPGKAGKFGPNQ